MKSTFSCFENDGRVYLQNKAINTADIPWNRHPAFEGVELKHLITSSQTGGSFSYHMVKVAPGKKIGKHIHETQLETHEIIEGNGVCLIEGLEFVYEPGMIAVLPAAIPHEVIAYADGLHLFVKFMPALV